MKLQGKVAIITGGSRGIGYEMAQLFVSEGARVIMADLSAPAQIGPEMAFFELNVTDREACASLYHWAIEQYQTVDILVNNAGITQDKLTATMTDDMWDRVLDVNLTGVFNVTRHIGPHMNRVGQGSIINIASIVGQMGNIGQANYVATKAGVMGLTKAWAKEFALKGAQVRVNAIAPGFIETDMTAAMNPKVVEQLVSTIVLGRMGQPADIAKAALFLASEDAAFITGHTLSVNGGQYI